MGVVVSHGSSSPIEPIALSDLVGKDLGGFKIVLMTEVYRKDDDGRKTKSLGFFRDETIAKAFAGQQKDAPWHGTQKDYVLTNGAIAYLVRDGVRLFNDEKEALEIKKRAMEKLSPEEQSILSR